MDRAEAIRMISSRLVRLPFAACALAAACTSTPTSSTAPIPAREQPSADPNVVPTVRREFRGVWVATVGNIDWPSKPGLPADQQRDELVSLLDRAKAAHMNAVIFHVRPAADAVYRSALEPWASMLTGTQGVDPGFDPLALAVEESHARGMELHAWINPFRAGNSADTAAKLASNHIFRQRRDLVRVYGPQLWMDPGEPDVQDRSMAAVLDIVRRYDVDGVHLDDYFYPYPTNDAAQRPLAFPDSATYARYGNGTPLADWRRGNVDRFIERLYREVHAVKPTVRVGVSPFGIWRPNNPAGIAGLDAFDAIYADARKWLQSGWVDYLAPQLYWKIDPPQQSFPALLDWWLAQNTRGRHVWPGLATYRVYQTTNAYPLVEIENQMRITQSRTNGMLFYNATATLSRNGGEMAAMLARGPLADDALPPAATWLDARAPGTPTIVASVGPRGSFQATLVPAGTEVPRWWLVRWRSQQRWTTELRIGSERTLSLVSPTDAAVDWVVVNAVDAVGNMSPDATWRRP
jgi:uncharacterized lipoprotein YddW (UPF0748 family)